MNNYLNIDDIKRLAELQNCSGNPLFIQTLKNYETVQTAISMIDASLKDMEAVITKEYVKGRENVYTNPLIKELPAQVTTANKTLKALMEIIGVYGVSPEVYYKLKAGFKKNLSAAVVSAITDLKDVFEEDITYSELPKHLLESNHRYAIECVIDQAVDEVLSNNDNVIEE